VHHVQKLQERHKLFVLYRWADHFVWDVRSLPTYPLAQTESILLRDTSIEGSGAPQLIDTWADQI